MLSAGRRPASTTLSSTTSSHQSPSSSIRCDIAIFGGGFGGLYTAFALDMLCRQKGWDNWDIALVDPNDSFVFLPLLYDLTVAMSLDGICRLVWHGAAGLAKLAPP